MSATTLNGVPSTLAINGGKPAAPPKERDNLGLLYARVDRLDGMLRAAEKEVARAIVAQRDAAAELDAALAELATRLAPLALPGGTLIHSPYGTDRIAVRITGGERTPIQVVRLTSVYDLEAREAETKVDPATLVGADDDAA